MGTWGPVRGSDGTDGKLFDKKKCLQRRADSFVAELGKDHVTCNTKPRAKNSVRSACVMAVQRTRTAYVRPSATMTAAADPRRRIFITTYATVGG